MGATEQSAAQKAAGHANTPAVAHLDALGRAFLTIADNGADQHGAPQKYATRVVLDIEGNQREVIDAKDRAVMRYDYDLLGVRIHQAGMEAGERWTLNDAKGKPIRAWDSRRFIRRAAYDELRRPAGLFVTESGVERLAELTVYGEGLGDAGNHRARVHQLFDGAGVVTSEIYDFKGNLLRRKRELLPDYKQAVNWLQNLATNDGAFTSDMSFDALNRPVTMTTPDNSVYRLTFNEANLLDRLEVSLRGAATATPFVTNVNYNAKGQRELIAYGNGAQTAYEYDPLTFRLTKLATTRLANPDDAASQLFNSMALVQDLRYAYDPAGNITRIEDSALKTIFHNGEQVEPVCDYSYDAIYRLIEARGREHIGQTAFDFAPPNGNFGGRRDFPFFGSRANPNDPQAMRNYTERYEYDEVGNFKLLRHAFNGGGWNRAYDYEEASLLEPAKASNRLTRTTAGGFIEIYTYKDAQGADVNGCMTAINSMKMTWDFEDRLQGVDLGGGGAAYYVYDAGGQRVRKVIETQNGTRKEERIYLGGYEIYREYDGGGTGVKLERETLHMTDDKRRVALVETKTIENGAAINAPAPLQRFQIGNHLVSVSLELDGVSKLISHEEYHPYGATSFQARGGAAEVSLKRYRYTGKERDEESGLYYHGARYYAPWFGRWVNTDPTGIVDGANLFAYTRNNPLRYTDPTGTQCDPTIATCPELMGNWSYATPVPDRASVGHNVQRDHPIQVTLRSEQRGGQYTRSVSAARGEQTVLVETGRGYFHTEVGRLQREINARVRAGVITTESELIEATREAYRLASEATGVAVNEQALDRAIVSNLATLSETAEQTRAELSRLSGPTTVTEESISRAFHDPSPPPTTATGPSPVANTVSNEARAATSETQTAANTALKQEANAVVSTEVRAGANAARSEASLLSRAGGVGGLVSKALFVLNIYLAHDAYQEGVHATTVAPAGPGVLAVGSQGEGILNAAGALQGGPQTGTMLREAAQLGTAVHDPGKLWNAVTSGASPTSVGMGLIFGAFR
jgi:RHS repeat-associated protein